MINCTELMKNIGYANKSQATRLLKESKDFITQKEAQYILEKIGATKVTSANKERVIKAQVLLANGEYLNFTSKLEEKKTTTKKAVAKNEPPKRTESEEIAKYQQLVKKLNDEIIRLKAENLALKLGAEWEEQEGA